MIKFLDNEPTIIDPIELGMFFLKSLEISHSLVSTSETNNIIYISYLVGIVSVESDCTTMDLIYTHICTHSREIDECIYCRTIPSFTEDSACSDHKFCFSFGELFCHCKNRFIFYYYFYSIFYSPNSLSRDEIRIELSMSL